MFYKSQLTIVTQREKQIESKIQRPVDTGEPKWHMTRVVIRVVTRVVRGVLTVHDLRRRTRRIPYEDDAAL